MVAEAVDQGSLARAAARVTGGFYLDSSIHIGSVYGV
jgi:hypothetical protein